MKNKMTYQERFELQNKIDIIMSNTIDLVDGVSRNALKPLIKKGLVAKNGADWDYESIIKLTYALSDASVYYGDYSMEVVLGVLEHGTIPQFKVELNEIIKENLK